MYMCNLYLVGKQAIKTFGLLVNYKNFPNIKYFVIVGKIIWDQINSRFVIFSWHISNSRSILKGNQLGELRCRTQNKFRFSVFSAIVYKTNEL